MKSPKTNNSLVAASSTPNAAPRRPLRTGVTAGGEEGYTGSYSWNDNDYCGMASGLSNLKLIN